MSLNHVLTSLFLPSDIVCKICSVPCVFFGVRSTVKKSAVALALHFRSAVSISVSYNHQHLDVVVRRFKAGHASSTSYRPKKKS